MKYKAHIVIAYFEECGLPTPATEYQFHPDRKWRFDFAWPEHKIALEVEGGGWTGGRHSRGAGMKKDMEKYNAAVVRGWRLLRVMPDQVCMFQTIELVRILTGLYDA